MLITNFYLLTLFVCAIAQLLHTAISSLTEIIIDKRTETSKLDWLTIRKKAIRSVFLDGLVWGNWLYLFFKDNDDPRYALSIYFFGVLLLEVAWSIFLVIRSKLFPLKESIDPQTEENP